jgi:hypothetical protein
VTLRFFFPVDVGQWRLGVQTLVSPVDVAMGRVTIQNKIRACCFSFFYFCYFLLVFLRLKVEWS